MSNGKAKATGIKTFIIKKSGVKEVVKADCFETAQKAVESLFMNNDGGDIYLEGDGRVASIWWHDDDDIADFYNDGIEITLIKKFAGGAYGGWVEL
ncbi:hypothetical protein NSQ26_05845 [Bacillus sp. FSL W7-1360]